MSKRFDQVVEIMSRLRGEGGCPWDRKQTRESLKPYLIEEAYEVLETIEAQDDPRLKEELGDVLLQILFHAEIGRERRTFTIEDVLETLADKLVRRGANVRSVGLREPGSGCNSRFYSRLLLTQQLNADGERLVESCRRPWTAAVAARIESGGRASIRRCHR